MFLVNARRKGIKGALSRVQIIPGVYTHCCVLWATELQYTKCTHDSAHFIFIPTKEYFISTSGPLCCGIIPTMKPKKPSLNSTHNTLNGNNSRSVCAILTAGRWCWSLSVEWEWKGSMGIFCSIYSSLLRSVRDWWIKRQILTGVWGGRTEKNRIALILTIIPSFRSFEQLCKSGSHPGGESNGLRIEIPPSEPTIANAKEV